MAEGLEVMLAALGDDGLRRVAVWKLEGRTNDEIAGRRGVARGTVERRLTSIRAVLAGAGYWPTRGP